MLDVLRTATPPCTETVSLTCSSDQAQLAQDCSLYVATTSPTGLFDPKAQQACIESCNSGAGHLQASWPTDCSDPIDTAADRRSAYLEAAGYVAAGASVGVIASLLLKAGWPVVIGSGVAGGGVGFIACLAAALSKPGAALP